MHVGLLAGINKHCKRCCTAATTRPAAIKLPHRGMLILQGCIPLRCRAVVIPWSIAKKGSAVGPVFVSAASSYGTEIVISTHPQLANGTVVEVDMFMMLVITICL